MCSVHTRSPHTLSFGTCGRVCATTMETWLWIGVCVCVCFKPGCLSFLCSAVSDCLLSLPLSILQYINQRLQHRERWVGTLTSTFVPREFTAASRHCLKIAEWKLVCLFLQDTSLRCIKPAASARVPVTLSCLAYEEKPRSPSVIVSSGGGREQCVL